MNNEDAIKVRKAFDVAIKGLEESNTLIPLSEVDNDIMNNDLISREALKEAIMKLPNDNSRYYYTGDLLDRERVLDEIDNAPTVAYPFEKFRTMLCGTCQANMRTEPDRPKGEWIGIKTSCNIGHKFYFCSVCSREIDLFDSETLEDYPFCHCGADMRGAKE